jgi:oral-facial-digital syndrome 1 protein
VKAPSTEKDSDGIPLLQRAANSIVAEYLKRCNFEYTLSTFLPESGTTLEKVLFLSSPVTSHVKLEIHACSNPWPDATIFLGMQYL